VWELAVRLDSSTQKVTPLLTEPGPEEYFLELLLRKVATPKQTKSQSLKVQHSTQQGWQISQTL
jgi:hypothetical protein